MGADDTKDLIRGAEKLIADKRRDQSADSLVDEANALVGSKKRDEQRPSTKSLIADAERIAVRRDPPKRGSAMVIAVVLIAVAAAAATWFLLG